MMTYKLTLGLGIMVHALTLEGEVGWRWGENWRLLWLHSKTIKREISKIFPKSKPNQNNFQF